MYISPLIARQQLCKHIPAANVTCNNRRIVGYVVFYAVLVISKESLWICLFIPLSLLGNSLVNTFLHNKELEVFSV
jgi:hypothetical protein